jgi:glycerophosphoryl diester phosphodiesterase
MRASGSVVVRGMLVPVMLVWAAGLARGQQRGAERAAEGPAIVAHRGLLRHAPENTAAAFGACFELRLGFELDVRRAADGTLVCVHDETVDRTTNGRGRVEELTMGELKALDAGAWFNPAFRGERIPTIEELFAALARRGDDSTLAAVDMKGADERIEPDVVALAVRHGVLKRLVFIGRTIEVPEVRQRLKAADPAARVARLAASPAEFAGVTADKSCNWVYVRFIPDAAQVRQAQAAGKRVFLAGPLVAGREPANWAAAARAGIDAILTDYPLELRQALRDNITQRGRQ